MRERKNVTVEEQQIFLFFYSTVSLARFCNVAGVRWHRSVTQMKNEDAVYMNRKRQVW